MPNGPLPHRSPNRQQSVHQERHQAPQTLLITCSDCLAETGSFTNRSPKELFVIRNAGNLVPIFGTDANTAASIEYTVDVLKVSRVLVVGHTPCEAISRVVANSPTGEPTCLQKWLTHAHQTKDAFSTAHDNPVSVIKHNLLCQLENLKTHPSVIEGLRKGTLTLEARIYNSHTGTSLPVYHQNEKTPQQKLLFTSHSLAETDIVTKSPSRLTQPTVSSKTNLDHTLHLSGSRLSEAVIVRNSARVFACLLDVQAPPRVDPFFQDCAQHLRETHEQGRSLQRALTTMPISGLDRHALEAQTLGFIGCELRSDRLLDVYGSEGTGALFIREGAVVGELLSTASGGFMANAARWLLKPADRVLLFTKPLNEWTGVEHILSLVSQDDPELAASSLQEILTMLSGKEQLFTLLTFGEPQSVTHQPADVSGLLEPLERAVDSLFPSSNPTQPSTPEVESALARSPQEGAFEKLLWPEPNTAHLVTDRPEDQISANEAVQELAEEPSLVGICLPEDLSAFTAEAFIQNPLIKELPEFDSPSLQPWDSHSPALAPTHQVVSQSVHLLSQRRYRKVWLFVGFVFVLLTMGLLWFSQR